MNKNLKKIIAKEGLILGGFILSEVFLISLGFILGWLLPYKEDSFLIITFVGFYVVPIGYPLHLFTRFIIWAIKTVRER